MARTPLIGAAIALIAAGFPAAARDRTPHGAGHMLFEGAFNPERNFAGDIEPDSDDKLLLTAAASVRDDYAPAYSLAVAYDCYGVESGCRHVARILRVGSGNLADNFENSFAMLHRVLRANSSAGMSAALEASGLQWLEADLWRCEGAIAAMDHIRTADWRPDLHHSLRSIEDPHIILHPAMIRIRMTGSYTTSRYAGWVLAPGAPAAVAKFLEVLEPCWTPSRTAPPWRRTLRRSRTR